MDLYFDRHDGEAATVEQFVQCFADVSGRDLSQFMLWYSQSGTPEVVATGTYDAAAKSYRLDLAQTLPPTPGQPVKKPMVIPLALGLVGKDGRDLALRNERGALERPVIELTDTARTIVFSDVPDAPVLSLNRGFSAPIRLGTNLSAGDLQALAARDSDPFNRWQALQTLATRSLVDSVAAQKAGRQPSPDSGLIAALAAILADATLEPAFVALSLAMPSDADIAREIGRDVDPDAIFRARTALRAVIGQKLASALSETLRRPVRSRALLARRRQRRPSLAAKYLPRSAGRGRQTRCDRARLRAIPGRRQHDRSHGCARHLVAARCAARATRLCRISTIGTRSDPLIIDKWLTLQAMIPEPQTLERVRALTEHPAFSMGNPNRVRALIGFFAQAT